MSRYRPEFRKVSIVVILSLLCSLFPFVLTALPVPDVLDQSVFSFEFFTFGREDMTKLEIFCEIPARHFQFVKYADGFYASYEIFVVLFDGEMEPVDRAVYMDSVKVRTFSEIDRPLSPHLVRFEFVRNPGAYTARIAITDLETQRKAEFDKTINLPDYSVPELSLSDIQLANLIVPCREKGSFVRSGKKISPNVRRIFSPESRNLYLYAEIYGLQYGPAVANGAFMLTYSILDADGVEIKREKTEMRTPAEATVLAMRIVTGAAKKGSYTLNLTVQDMVSEQTVQKSTSFSLLGSQRKNI